MVSRRHIAVLMGFTALYFALQIPAAVYRPFWNDELFTYYIARAPSIRSVIQAVATGADQHPLPFYLIERWSGSLVGWHELGLRLPSMYAGWLLGLCAFALGARYGGLPGGGLSLGLTLLSGAYEFDTEARGYAMMAMFGGLATVIWVYLRHQVRGARVLVSLLIAAATMSHYYGVFLGLPFVFAEAMEKPRRFGRLLLPLAAPVLAIAASLPVLRGAPSYAAVFWGRPSLAALVETYIALGGVSLAVGVVLFAVAMLARPRWTALLDPSPPTTEVALFVGFLLLPVAIVAISAVTTNTYAPRYALGAITGLGPLAVIAFRSLGAPPRWIRRAGLVVGLIWVGREVVHARYTYWQRLDLNGRIGWILQHSDSTRPIVTWSGPAFLVLSHYGSPELSHRLRVVADPVAAMRYEGENLSDRGMRSLAPWFPKGILDTPTLERDYPHFTLFGETAWDGRWNWITSSLIRRQWTLRLAAQNHNIWLFLVDRTPR